MASITTLSSSQNFRDWFNKTNEIIGQVNIQDAIGVTGISAGTGISLAYVSGKNVVSLLSTIPSGLTIGGNIRIQGDATIDGSLSVSSLSVNTTTISYTPKLAGLTSGNVVSIQEIGGLTLAKADNSENAEVFGIVIGENASSTLVAVAGKIDNSTFSGTVANALGFAGATLYPGIAYFLSPSVAGGITSIEPNGYGQVSKPVLLGVTGDTGVILPYRGFVIEGITAGITAELDNKIIISVNYSLGSPAKKDGVVAVKIGDPVYVVGENVTPGHFSSILSSFGTITETDIKLCGGSNSNATPNTLILKTASSMSLRNHCVGVVSGVLLDDGTSMILEVLTRGGNIKIDLDDLDSNVYNTTAPVGGLFKYNNTTKKFEPQSPVLELNTSWANIVRNNDAENTATFILNHTEYFDTTGGGVSSLAPLSTVVYQGVTGGITLISSDNLLVNGSFRVWQRGDTNYSGATLGVLGTYFTPLCDRWFASTHGCTSMALTFGKYEFDSTQNQVLGSPVYYVQYSNTFTTKNTGSLVQRPKFENIIRGGRYLNGQTGTIAFYAKAGISGATIDAFYNRYEDSYATSLGLTSAIESRVIVNYPGLTLTADWKEYSLTFKLNNGITLAGDEEGWFSVGFEMPNTTTYSLAQVRFNLGDIAAHPLYTEFEKELNECKRYYQTSYSYGVLPQTANDNNLNEATLDLPNLGAINHFNIRFPIRMVGDAKNIRIYSPISGVSGEAYNISAGTDLYQSNGTQIIVPWSIASPWRTNAKLTKNIYVDTMKRDGFVVVVDGGAYSTDRIKFHWVADADFSRSII